MQAEDAHRSVALSCVATRRWAVFCMRTSYGWQANLRRPPPLTRCFILAEPRNCRICVVVYERAGEFCQRVVYVLKNSDNPPRYYTGVTSDLGARLQAHNAGRCVHTAKRIERACDL